MICFHNNTSPPALLVPPPPSPCFARSEPTKPPARGTRPWRGQDPRYHVSGATRALPHCSSWPGFWVRACSCQHGTEDGVPQVSPWTDPAPAAVRDFVHLFSSRMMHTYGCYPSPCWSWWQGSPHAAPPPQRSPSHFSPSKCQFNPFPQHAAIPYLWPHPNCTRFFNAGSSGLFIFFGFGFESSPDLRGKILLEELPRAQNW